MNWKKVQDGDDLGRVMRRNVLVKKHDHILIPVGTIHCSGADTVKI